MADLPRVQRGEVGAIVMRSDEDDALLTAAREDLEDALHSFGHPVVQHRISPLQLLDKRFRRAAVFGWFRSPNAAPSVRLAREADFATLRVSGAVELAVPWLPCASASRIERCALRRSPQSYCETVAVCGDGAEVLRGDNVIRVTAEMLLGQSDPIEVACVVHADLTDDAAFGNVLLAQAGIPAVALDRPDLRAVFAGDVALFSDENGIQAAAQRFVDDVSLRESYGRRVAADASRRFSPRRTAIRVVDLLCTARFGLERPGKARSNSPL
jgi:hypothetical protein